MDPLTYKTYHESFMLSNNGTTQLELLEIIIPTALTSYTASILFHTAFANKSNLFRFISEFIIIILPIILTVTVLSHLTKILASITLVIFIMINCKLFQSGIFKQPLQKILNIQIDNKRRQFITSERSIINVITAVCILAVDFQVFPRRFAKTETYGFGLMDTGVGLYVFGNAIIAPEIYKESNAKIMKVVKKQLINTIPLFVLGICRFIITTKLVDYQQHVSEYGIHWNFFITLALTKLLGTVLTSLVTTKYVLHTAVVVTVIHEYILSFGIAQWVFDDIPRNNILSANREGVVSLLGYVALYLYSVKIGDDMYMKTTILKDNALLLMKLIIYVILSYLVTVIYHSYFGVSRRLANLGYITFVLTLGVIMAAVLLLNELMLYTRNYYDNHSRNKPFIYVPLIFRSVDTNGLTFFILANILTGVVNVSIQTMFANPVNSVLIITIYMLITNGILTILYIQQVKLKVW